MILNVCDWFRSITTKWTRIRFKIWMKSLSYVWFPDRSFFIGYSVNFKQRAEFSISSMAPIFFAFSFFVKNEEKRAIFCEKWKKIIPMKKGQNCIQLNKCYKFFNRLTGKISTQEFSSSFYHFLCWRQCGALEIYQKSPT